MAANSKRSTTRSRAAPSSKDIPPATWSRFDLRRGVVNIDRDKTGDPRPIPLDPGVWRALKAWREMQPNAKPTDPVFVDMRGKPIDAEGLAETFREKHLRPALQAADMDRLELYERSTVRQPLRLHDLRASFVTIAFSNGRDERWVRDRTGHRSGALERYRRVARTVEELDLGDWVSLEKRSRRSAAAFTAANAAATRTIRARLLPKSPTILLG